MRKLITACLLATLASILAQPIPYTDARNHIGSDVTIQGLVSSTNTIGSGMSFLNFGQRGDADSFTVVSKSGTLTADAIKAFEGKSVDVAGTITLYKDSPQIVLASPTSITLSGSTPSPAPSAPNGNPTAKPPEPTAATPEVRLFNIPLERGETRDAGETSGEVKPEKANAAIFVPAGLDLKQPQKVLAVFPDFFSDNDLAKLIAPYLPLANEKKIIVLAARGPTLEFEVEPAWHTVMFQAATRQLSEKYPDIQQWTYYLAGNGDGASRAGLSLGGMIKEKFLVKGIYLSTVTRNDIEKSAKEFRPSRSVMKNVKVYISDSGKMDPEALETLAEDIQDVGPSEVKIVQSSAGAGIDQENLAEALEWFTSAETSE